MHIDPKYTLTAPSHWAEVMQTPNLLGRSLTLNNVVSSPANCQGSMGQGVVVGGGGHDPQSNRNLLQLEPTFRLALAGTF